MRIGSFGRSSHSSVASEPKEGDVIKSSHSALFSRTLKDTKVKDKDGNDINVKTKESWKDFGDRFDKTLKPYTLGLGSLTQLTTLASFGENQKKEADSSKGSSSSSTASETTDHQSTDLAPIPDQTGV